jgi:membrane fusion protein, multidrug efflux system
MRFVTRWFLWCGVIAALAGCKSEGAAPQTRVRPVLSTVTAFHKSGVSVFAGTVEPRYRSSHGFKVLGRIIARDVNVADVVKQGMRLAAIDPITLRLAVRATQADLSSAQAQLANASAVESRQATLLQQGVATPATLEAAQQGREAAAAAVLRAQAALAKAEEQLRGAQLTADFDGVVTSIDAEVGQVVAPGQSVITIARPDVREAVVDLPDDMEGPLNPGTQFEVGLQTDPSVRAVGRVREIAPQADPTTRTRRVRVTLQDPPARFRLGTTVTATLSTTVAQSIDLPASALLERDGQTMVWVVDPTSSTVALRHVSIGVRTDDSFQVVDGLASGVRVVTAGVNSLAPGQQVMVSQETSR